MLTVSRALKNAHGFEPWLRPLCCCVLVQNTTPTVPLSTGNCFDKMFEETVLVEVILRVASCFRSLDDRCHFQPATRLVDYKVSKFSLQVTPAPGKE